MWSWLCWFRLHATNEHGFTLGGIRTRCGRCLAWLGR